MDTSVRLTMIGCNQRHSSLAVRERLAFTPAQTLDALAAWRVTHPDTAIKTSAAAMVHFEITGKVGEIIMARL